MIVVQCEKCLSSFKLEASKIPASGTKVRCGKCSHIFTVMPPKTEPVENPDLADIIMSSTTENAQQEKAAASTTAAATPYKVSPEAMQKYQSMVNQSFKKVTQEPATTTNQPPPTVSTKHDFRNTVALFIFTSLLCLIGICIQTGNYLPTNIWASLKYGYPVDHGKINVVKSEATVFQSSNLENIFKIKGYLFNASEKPTQSIPVKVDIYDPSDNVIASKTIPCCDQMVQPGTSKEFEAFFTLPEKTSIKKYKLSLK